MCFGVVVVLENLVFGHVRQSELKGVSLALRALAGRQLPHQNDSLHTRFELQSRSRRLESFHLDRGADRR